MGKSLLRICLLLTLSVWPFHAPARSATFGFDEIRPYQPMGVLLNSPAKRMAISFVLPPEMNGKQLSTVKVVVKAVYGSPSPIVVELCADAGGWPGSTILAQGTLTPAQVGWRSVAMTPQPVIAAGVRYHLVLHAGDGTADEDNYFALSYQMGRFRPDFTQEIDFGDGWFSHPNADPSIILAFSDGSAYGQSYGGNTDGWGIYGTGIYCRIGESFVLSAPMTVRRIAVAMSRVGTPPVGLKVVLTTDSGGPPLVDELFSTPRDVSWWRPDFLTHVLSSPVTLAAGTRYKLYFTHDGTLDPSAYYVAVSKVSGDNSLSFGGANCWMFIETSAGANIPYLDRDMYFMLHDESPEFVRLGSFDVTESSVTVVAESNMITNATIDYGTTLSYGSTRSSEGKTLHRFDLTGLSAGDIYHYKITLTNPVDSADSASSGDCTFKTSSDNGAFDVAVIGDTQSGAYRETMKLASTYPHDLVLTLGDNVLADSTPDYSDCMNEWRWFLSRITPLTRNGVLYTSLGNHDSYYTYNDPNRLGPLRAYQDSVVMPANGSGDERYYSFDYGPAHFVVLDTMSPTSHTSPSNVMPASELTWLQNDLASSNKPWKIALCHFNVSGLSQDELSTWWQLANWSQLQSVLRAGGVTLVLQGHHHIYNRYIKDGVCYVTNSTQSVGDTSGAYFETAYSGFAPKMNSGGDPGTISSYLSQVGWVQLRVTTDQIRGDFIDVLGRKLDSFTLPQNLVVTYSPDGGDFAAPASVTVNCTSPGVVIHYTTNGREPTEADPVVAAGGPVLVDRNMTLKAKAFGTQPDSGDTKSSDFIVHAATPFFDPPPGYYTGTQNVAIGCATPGAIIRYTTDESEPTPSSLIAGAPVAVTFGQPVTIRARAYKSGMASSSTASATYTVSYVLVNKNAAGPIHDGKSWATALLSIGEAISLAGPDCEIWVTGSSTNAETGTYHERISLKDGVAIYGGFAGNETTRSQRNPSLNVTTLDGDSGGSVVTVPADVSTPARLDGFVILDGIGTLISGYRYGGGVYCQGAAVLSTNRIVGNSAAYGGGVFCGTGGSMTLMDSFVSENTCSILGAGIYCAGSSPTIVNNTVISNSGPSAGGIYIYGGVPAIVNNIVAYNSTGIGKDPTSAPELRTNCVYGNGSSNYSGLSPGAGDITLDPKLLSLNDYRLEASSPCVDAGDAGSPSEQDIDGNPRPQDGDGDGAAAVDIGCQERKKPTPPSDAKKPSEGVSVEIGPVVVTAVFADRFYVESVDRSSGIGITGATSTVGTTVVVDGMTTETDGERLIAATTVDATSTNATVDPVLTGIRSLGGGSYFQQSAVSAWRSWFENGSINRRPRNSSGITNIGLLVKVIGRVRFPASGCFYLDDVSGIDEGDPAKPGVRVNWPWAVPMPSEGSLIQLSAISSCTTVALEGQNYVVRMLRPVSATAYTVILPN